MLEIQLYINNQRLDMFKDESISLTDSIQNIRDIDKIFTSFSRSFNLPASKTNSKIFKHYYNFHIDSDFSFDARVKTPANIELNSLPFRRGYIKLEGVDLKENIPYSYRVTFFGEIVKLKDEIGESKLSDLQGLGSVIYNSSLVSSYLTRDETQGFDELVPLITHTQRLYWDSGTSTHNTGNLAVGGNKHGVKWNELKPAMRVNKIIEAIETTFPRLQFTDDFFKNTSVPKMDKLFLWLSRKSGYVENLSGALEVVSPIVFPSGSSSGGAFSSYDKYIFLDGNWFFVNSWTYTLSHTSGTYTAVVYDDYGQILYSSGQVNGNLTIFKNDLNLPASVTNVTTYLEIKTTSQAVFSNIRWNGNYEYYGDFDSYQVNTGVYSTPTDFTFDYALQMPDITILDFLSGLFRTFNLTAFVQQDGKIKVQPLDEFYNENPKYRDITKYVGIEKSSVDAALPYRQVKFDFADTKSFLANKYGEINNKAWGLLQYNNNQNDLTGSLYRVTSPFGHFLYEKLTDNNNGNPINVQWGYSVDKSQNAMLPKPLLFYPVNPSQDVPQISFVDEVDENNEPVSDIVLTPKAMPMNTYSTVPSTGDFFQLNFALEQNEWTGATDYTETLFSSYKKYIEGIFNPKQRITKVEVMLPLADLLQIQMNDVIIIADNHYIINKLDTNLQTGKSELELINKFY